MTPSPSDRRFLWHMLEHATHVAYITLGVDLDTYEDTVQLRLAAERGLDIFCRAAANLTPSFRDAHGDIPWQRIAAVAAVLDYPKAAPDDEMVWAFVRKELPRVMEHLEPLMGAGAGEG